MVRLGYALGVKLTVWVACAGIVTLWLTVTGVPPPGGVMVAVTWPAWAVLVLLVMSVLTVSAELLRSAAWSISLDTFQTKLVSLPRRTVKGHLLRGAAAGHLPRARVTAMGSGTRPRPS